ncbi:MAG: cytochrome b N-terminal domain-containing protein [Deltaproteobacteria bacterium]|nr:cytochrome b N-terminal domain-containing protein [Deltaproteobacteria bacterium]
MDIAQNTTLPVSKGDSTRTARLISRVLAPLDRLFQRCYDSPYNPLYLSGALTLFFLLLVLVTGAYLLIFYRAGSPYESMAAIQEQVWGGRWIRALHRYASDAAVVTAVLHMLRMFAQGRSWGPRALGWITGVGMLALLWGVGWTGYVLVWDQHGLILANRGARMLDALPLFSEPISRMFATGQVVYHFFFFNLFLHMAIPLVMGALLWMHVMRLARSVLFPSRGLMWGSGLLLTGLSVVWPAPLEGPADALSSGGRVAVDGFYTFWLGWNLSGGALWLFWLALLGGLTAVPWLFRPGLLARPRPAVVDEAHCEGCTQCYQDCPYEAIQMVAVEGREKPVARVDPAVCVGCGICSGSCKPMVIGPPERRGGHQIRQARALTQAHPQTVVCLACDKTLGRNPTLPVGVTLWTISCGGEIHADTVDALLRHGAAGVMVVSCPPENCQSREGARWLAARWAGERDMPLRARVDRRRTAWVTLEPGDTKTLARLAAQFLDRLNEPGLLPVREESGITPTGETLT